MFDVVTGRRKDRKEPARAAAVSVGAHLLLIALLVILTRGGTTLFQPVGVNDSMALGAPGGGGGGGGGGGETVTYVDLSPPPPPPAPTPEPDPLQTPVPPPVVPPVPTPSVQQPKPDAQPTPAPVQPAPATNPAPGPGAGAGPGQGSGQGAGQGPGSGPGSGGGSGGGTGGGIGSGTGPGTGAGRIRPPTTEVLLIPPQRPRNLGTRDVILRLSVDERGKVREVEVVTPTGNRGYDDSLKRTAMAWEFSPAREQDTNRPVAAKLDVTVTI